MTEPLATTAPAPQRSLWERIGRWSETLSDRLNPLVVKEVRQGLRTRVFWMVFGLMLVACLLISLVTWAASTGERVRDWNGQGYFAWVFAPLAFAYFLVLPYSAFRSLLKERDDETWVLLTLTGLGPRRILRGKLGSSAVQAALYGSAVLPFLVLSYDLNGVDLLALGAVILLSGLFHVFLVTGAVSLATFAENRMVRGLVSLSVAALLLFGVGSSISIAYALIEDGQLVLQTAQFWIVTGVSLWGMVSTGVLLFEAAAARLSLHSENYAVGPRLALTGQLLGTLALITFAWWSEHREATMALPLLGMLGGYLTLCGVFLSTDLDGQAPRLRKLRGPARLFTPGAVRGYRFFVAALLTVAVVALVLGRLSSSAAMRVPGAAIVAAPAYALLYVSVPVLLICLFRVRGVRGIVLSRAITVALVMAGIGIPQLVGEVLFQRNADRTLNLFNPVLGLAEFTEHSLPGDRVRLAILCGVTLAVWLLTDLLLAQRDREALRGGR